MRTDPHAPSNFEPRDYRVEDYLDNHQPTPFGSTPNDRELWEEEVRNWRRHMAATFGADWQHKIHHCIHCGNANVRWITAVRHAPTGDVVVFGADCTKRLGFANQNEFKLAQLKARAVLNAREIFLAAHPSIVTALEAINKPEHEGNHFVKDVLSKLDRYGSLSDRQVAAVEASLKRDVEMSTKRAAEAVEPKGDAPEGRVEITGTVLSIQERENDYGLVTKMLLKLANNAKVWLTAPRNGEYDKGDTITVRATFERSRDDRSFGFGKRPVFVRKERAS